MSVQSKLILISLVINHNSTFRLLIGLMQYETIDICSCYYYIIIMRHMEIALKYLFNQRHDYWTFNSNVASLSINKKSLLLKKIFVVSILSF